ncbi:MAG: secondary thiamine-phosphate synthase enzyme YjbQ [Thermoclostridium sp.]|nr:secondary thiamine-phosphate synthase enzyme YjbQ [Thermoclostridium sp.]
MVYKYSLRTGTEGFYNITTKVQQSVKESGITEGICVVFCPHTTAGMTINENADPDVVSDMLFALNKTLPDRPEFRHSEGNTHSHLKASYTGSSVTVIVENGRLLLGTWQGIYFCEFDGPRNRSFHVKVLQG